MADPCATRTGSHYCRNSSRGRVLRSVRRRLAQLDQGAPVALMPVESITPQIERRAIEVQGILADRGEHRAPSIPDLLIAATAELCGLIALHQGKDFDLIAGITGQRLERLRTT